MTEADYTPIPMPTYDDLVDGGFRNAEMIDRLQRKIERLRTALQSIAKCEQRYHGDIVWVARKALSDEQR